MAVHCTASTGMHLHAYRTKEHLRSRMLLLLWTDSKANASIWKTITGHQDLLVLELLPKPSIGSRHPTQASMGFRQSGQTYI